MTSVDADVVVAGAGAAGLSLAARLARRTSLRVMVIDPRPGPSHDRTFCFFRGAAHPFEAAIARRYAEVEVRDASRIVRTTLAARPYEELPGLAFAELALRDIARSDRVQVRWGTSLTTFLEQRDRVAIDSSAGTLSAHLLVDARGGRTLAHATDDPDEVRWLQHFVGHEVRTERPIFTPSIATLMDFDVPQDDGPHFVYVLPTSEHEALVEDTYFSATRLPRERYEANIAAWLARRGAGQHEVLRREWGAIPMTTAPQSRAASGRVVVIGQRGGAAKASSGYAFQFIQRQCDALTCWLREHGAAVAVSLEAPRSRTATFFDRVMLSYLHQHPSRAPDVFVPLFASVPGDALARFLSEEGTAIDHLRVMGAVPKAGVLAEALRTQHLWTRQR